MAAAAPEDPLPPEDQQLADTLFYTWLSTLAVHGLQQDEVGDVVTSKETEITFDKEWTTLPSLDGLLFQGNVSTHLRLVGYGINNVIAVDSHHDPDAKTVKIQAFCLNMDQRERGWIKIGEEPAIGQDICEWETLQCAIVRNQLFLFHPKWNPKERFFDEGSNYVVVHSISLVEGNAQWDTTISGTLLPTVHQKATIVVRGQKIIFVGKRIPIQDSMVYDTFNKQWSLLSGAPVPERLDMTTTGGVIHIPGSLYIITADYQEEGTYCDAYNLSAMDDAICMAYIQDQTEETIHEDDEKEIPWADELADYCNMGGFALGASLYTFYSNQFERSDSSLVRHDFTTRSCHFSDDDDRIWFRPITNVPIPKPKHLLMPNRMVKVGKWWISGCSEPEESLDSEFQAIQVHPPATPPQMPLGGRLSFVHLGLKFYDSCIETLWDQTDAQQNFIRQRNLTRPRQYLSLLLAMDPSLAAEQNKENKLPLQMAMENRFVGGHLIRTILKAYPEGLKKSYPSLPSSLIPFLLVALQFPDGRTEEVVHLEAPSHMFFLLKSYREVLVEAQVQPSLKRKANETAVRAKTN